MNFYHSYGNKLIDLIQTYKYKSSNDRLDGPTQIVTNPKSFSLRRLDLYVKSFFDVKLNKLVSSGQVSGHCLEKFIAYFTIKLSDICSGC